MILVGIDIGKLSHMFCVMDSSTGEFLVDPISFKNNKQGFDSFMDSINSFSKKDVLIGMEDTGHYHFNLFEILTGFWLCRCPDQSDYHRYDP